MVTHGKPTAVAGCGWAYDRAMLSVRPERFIAGGETLAHDDDGRVVFVRGGLPGELVAVEVAETKGDWARGLAVEISEPSPQRREPPCEQRRRGCGGCDWQHLAAADQLAAKSDIVRDALGRTGRVAAPDIRLGASVPEFGYRTTIRVVGDEDGRASFRIERSHDLVHADGCLVADPTIARVVGDLLITPGLEVTLRTSVATDEMTAWWDRRDGDVVGLPDTISTGASAVLHEDVAGHRFRVSAGSFFQSGPVGASLLVDAVRRAAPELRGASTVLDAYAGVGLFAATVVGAEVETITVESSKAAVSDCRANLVGRRARVELGDVARWRPDDRDRIDVVIADPSRTGLGKSGVASLTRTEAPVIVLVSCDPVSLARDTALLERGGYRYVCTELLDLFPLTHHVEAVTRFERVTGPGEVS